MKKIAALLIYIPILVYTADGADLSTASSQELMAVYKQLRSLQGGDSATCENIIFKRDSATFTLLNGHITFAAPVAGQVLAGRFEGQGKFELDPPSVIDQRQISRYTGSGKLVDDFQEAVFLFTDDTFKELSQLLKVQPAPAAPQSPFASMQKQYAENFNDWIENQRKGNPTVRNIPARMLADLTDKTSKGFFLADFRAKKMGDLLFQISWNRDSLVLPDDAKGEEVLLLHLNPGNYYEWISGFHLSAEYAGSKHPDHRDLVANCTTEQIDMQIAKDNSLSATAQMEYVPHVPARVLSFNLNGVLRISSIQDAAGTPFSYIQEDRKLDSDPWIILPEPAKPEEVKKIKIIYKEDSTRDSRIVFQKGAGLYYVTSRESWFPSFGSFDDRTQFEIQARSPKKFKFVAAGSLISSRTEKDELVTSWKTEIPLGVVGFNYGSFVDSTQSAKTLSVTAYAGRDVPDELKYLEAQMNQLELSGETRNAEAATGILRGGFNTAANVKYAAGMSLQALSLYEFMFGALPFKSISVTEQPVRGYGQSWPNLIFLPYDSLLDATTRNSLRLADTGQEREFYNIVAVHEMAHQWWGHLVGWKTYHDQWLSEGVSEFASSLYLRQFEPKQVKGFWNLKRTWLLSKTPAGYRPVDAGPIWLNSQLDNYNGQGNSRLIYYKGAYVMEMLRMLLYDTRSQNPDGRFIAMMREFTKTYAGRNASTEDFRQIVEKYFQSSMEWFFDQWVYGTYTPKYDFSYQLSDAGSGQTELSLTITQSEVPETFQMGLPLYAVVNGEQRFLGLIPVKGNAPVKTSTKLPFKPESVVLDPNHSILAEIHQ